MSAPEKQTVEPDQEAAPPMEFEIAKLHHRLATAHAAILSVEQEQCDLRGQREEMKHLAAQKDERVRALEAENARLREALSLYSCDDGCNDCPETERDRVSCGWTALRALEQGSP